MKLKKNTSHVEVEKKNKKDFLNEPITFTEFLNKSVKIDSGHV